MTDEPLLPPVFGPRDWKKPEPPEMPEVHFVGKASGKNSAMLERLVQERTAELRGKIDRALEALEFEEGAPGEPHCDCCASRRWLVLKIRGILDGSAPPDEPRNTDSTRGSDDVEEPLP